MNIEKPIVNPIKVSHTVLPNGEIIYHINKRMAKPKLRPIPLTSMIREYLNISL
jgi:hypothetical protein